MNGYAVLTGITEIDNDIAMSDGNIRTFIIKFEQKYIHYVR